MKKFDKRWILFLVLIVLLASGLSYLTLHQETTKTAEQPKTQNMSIALVNEDKGSTFNGTELAFGDAFVSSVSENENNEWFVVSRGVAESGLKNNTYDMMIVIPNDFSEKSLNITAEAPERVVLQYKVNASESPQIKQQAEKTASDILNDFNRQIIDVYFASIIGNLQNAQDSIGQMVNRQAVYTNSYNSKVYQPLSGYTDQFNRVKSNTKASKESFTSFEDLLASYEEQLVDESQTGTDFVNQLDEVAKLKESNTTNLATFQEQMAQFSEGLTSAEVEQQLDQLAATNEAINQQFAANRENAANTSVMRRPVTSLNTANIYSGSVSLKQQLQQSSERVAALQQDIDAYLTESNEQFRAKIGERVNNTIVNELEEDSSLDIVNRLFDNPNRVAKDKIETAIRKLPSMDPEDFQDVGLPEEGNYTVQEITNVIATTNKYLSENNMSYNPDSDTLKDEFNRLNERLTEDGVQVTDTVILPENKKEGQIFSLNKPKGFSIENLKLQLPGEGEQDYTTKIVEEGKVKLPANHEGEFKVNLTLKKEKAENFDVFKPINWSWELEQKDIKDVDKPDELAYAPTSGKLLASLNINAETNLNAEDGKAEDNTNSTTPSKEDGGTEPNLDTEKEPNNDGEADQGNKDTPEDGPGNDESEQPDGPSGEDKPNDDGDAGEGPGTANPEEDKEDSGTEKPEEDKEEQEPEKLYIENNVIKHEISTSVEDLDKTAGTLVKTVTNSVSGYQELGALYESYYGFGLHELPKGFDKKSLASLSTPDSLHSLFNKKDIKQLLTDYMTGQITGSVAEQLRTPTETFRLQVSNYQEQLQQTIANADTLTNRVAATNEQAAVLNQSVNQTLEDVAAWRDQMLALLEQQAEIQTNAQGEQEAVLTLNSEFQPLLTSSQALAEQAQHNTNTAEQVYDTFESIDTQAQQIEESGTTLVSEAEKLASNMTDKLSDDRNFTENFTEVLENSRVGERQNENLYEFLSNPVQTSNEGTIAAQSETVFTPYYLVLISFIVVLFTAYVISTLHMKRKQNDQFASESSLFAQNVPITIISAGLGLLEGIVIGIVSSYYLPIDDMNKLQITAVMAFLITAMLLAATYLLRQLRMIGMFILLAIFSLYLFFTDAIGTASTAFPSIEKFSPLQYMETFMLRIVEGSVNYTAAIFILIVAAAAGAFVNLLVFSQTDKGVDIADEDQKETV
ncbi:type VII secretion protein EsaA, N-terminal domain-containing protein [Terribacillus aidingensis]|uniref:Type VII secretion system accessory factor EsaA n=1 Tax=Terribacillus aidingensis TaxID=586416 RepID=A0A285NX30_9BACI|nr:type VII secretion protein EsaA [Terribacillus aidingensis]SNZ14052.1 type VII secretion protein EsaA, N-terminal domain-containing protein [Terribacillus aidingensis]